MRRTSLQNHIFACLQPPVACASFRLSLRNECVSGIFLRRWKSSLATADADAATRIVSHAVPFWNLPADRQGGTLQTPSIAVTETSVIEPSTHDAHMTRAGLQWALLVIGRHVLKSQGMNRVPKLLDGVHLLEHSSAADLRYQLKRSLRI